jgi:hypothetical protein
VGRGGRRVSPGHFRVVGCRAFRLDFAEGLGDEPEERALFLPIMRQVVAPDAAAATRRAIGRDFSSAIRANGVKNAVFLSSSTRPIS